MPPYVPPRPNETLQNLYRQPPETARIPRLEFREVAKSFGATKALQNVSFSAKPGSIHAILGENGAGKSTLMNVLSGNTPQDSGTMWLDGELHTPNGPLAARNAGIAMVHQELSLCTHLTVTENIVLGMEPRRYALFDRKSARNMAEKALGEVLRTGGENASSSQTAIDPDALVSELPSSHRQLVEIARALAHPHFRVLVLDEPTSSLTASDTDRLFQVIRNLAQKGKTVLYISHFLEEVKVLADEFTVLRDGESIASGEVHKVEIVDLVEMMAGRKVSEIFPERSHRPTEEIVLSLENLCGERRPKDASLKLFRSEILGIFGLIGSGRTELLRAIFGLDPIVRGQLKIGTFVGHYAPAQRLTQGVGLLSEDRANEGVALDMSVADNITLSALDKLGRLGFYSPKRQTTAATAFIEKLTIKCSSALAPVRSLSGGNQQKVALSRLLYREVDILLLDEPTRGIDVTSKAQIYKLLFALAEKGKSVLLISSYLPELLGVCDRIAVMQRGTLGKARPAKDRTEEELIMEATGA